MKIRMTQTVPGSVDGINVQSYHATHDYDLSASLGARQLATAFVNAGLAEELAAPDGEPETAIAGEQVAKQVAEQAPEQVLEQAAEPARTAKPARTRRSK